MATFTTRVELHEKSPGDKPDYELLHQKMEARGFTRTITGEDGVIYRLPTAEYVFTGPVTKEYVRQRV